MIKINEANLCQDEDKKITPKEISILQELDKLTDIQLKRLSFLSNTLRDQKWVTNFLSKNK